MDEMWFLLAKQWKIGDCCVRSFAETCLHHNILDEVVALDERIVLQVERAKDCSWKSRGGREKGKGGSKEVKERVRGGKKERF